MKMYRLTLHVYLLLCFPSLTTATSASASLQDVHALRRFLFTNKTYDIQVRPLYNQSRSLILNMSSTIISLSSLSVTSGRIELHGYVTVTWRDEILQWNPDDYGGVDHLDLTVEEIWVPTLLQVLVGNNENMFENTSVLKLHSDGSVMWMTFGVLRGICDQQMQYYPFDKQICAIDIISSGSESSEITFLSVRNNVPIVNSDNGQWDWIEGRSETLKFFVPGATLSFDTFRIHATFRRKPDFLVIHIGLPYTILLLLNLFVFVTPLKSGERISFAVTLLLAFVFYSSYISGEIPENSNSISIVSVFNVVTLAMCTFTVAISIVLCKLLDSTDRHAPRWLQNLTRRILKIAHENKNGSVTTDKSSDVVIDNNVTMHVDINNLPIKKCVEKQLEKTNTGEQITWSIAALALDRLSLFFFAFTLIVTWIVAISLFL